MNMLTHNPRCQAERTVANARDASEGAVASALAAVVVSLYSRVG